MPRRATKNLFPEMEETDQQAILNAPLAERMRPRYLAEFDFRYNNRIALGVTDAERTRRALAGVVGKRLTYAM